MKNKQLSLLVATILTSSLSIAEVEIEVSGQAVFEVSKFLDSDDGMVEGNPTFKPHSADWFKNSADIRVYVDGDIDDIIEEATFHIEMNAFVNPLGSGAEKGNNYNEAYTQRDILREAYLDTEYADWQLRLGKQQVVWGTADGMKLLDMINPTDYTEMAQNQMEDSRIPVWMINGETDLENGTSLQVVLSEPRENIFAGLNRNIDTSERKNQNRSATWGEGGLPVSHKDNIAKSHDYGQFTVMRGPSSITGGYDGFLNIVPDMGSVASLFGEAFSPYVDQTTVDYGGLDNTSFDYFTVGNFLGNTSASNFGDYSDKLALENPTDYSRTATQDDVDNGLATNVGDTIDGFGGLNFAKWFNNMSGETYWLDGVANGGNQYGITGKVALNSFFTSEYESNLFDITDDNGDSDFENPNSAFEYMGNTTFRTFDAFVNARAQYQYNMPDATDLDFAIRNKGTLESGQNWQVAYSYGYDKNPIVLLNWKNNQGEYLINPDTNKIAVDLDNDGETDTYTLQLKDAAGNSYGGAAQTQAYNDAIAAGKTEEEALKDAEKRVAILEFREETTKIHSLGFATDTSIETEALGTVVLRGEAIYQKDTHQPTVHFDKLAYGDLANALEMREIDRLKFVLGFDLTLLTNMFSSLQVIRDINLDYMGSGDVRDADFATMMLTNGFNTGEEGGAVEFKEYYSLYFSKPFGVSGQHRWNNMTMYEGGDGWWNWFTVGFGMTDNVEATLELNHYWGNPNTAFGQHQKSNNIQVGFKYNF